MTQQEIIELARQAGFFINDKLTVTSPFIEDICISPMLKEFAKLIAEKEREACIAHAMTSAEKAIDVAIKLEREACAKVCEDDDSNAGEWHSETHVGGYFAKAIRARVQE